MNFGNLGALHLTWRIVVRSRGGSYGGASDWANQLDKSSFLFIATNIGYYKNESTAVHLIICISLFFFFVKSPDHEKRWRLATFKGLKIG